jgi:hypothetical protein
VVHPARGAPELIDHLKAAQAESKLPTPKQLRWIVDLTKKVELDEGSACALVGLASYDELSGGEEGTARAVIDALLAKAKGKGKSKGKAAPHPS